MDPIFKKKKTTKIESSLVLLTLIWWAYRNVVQARPSNFLRKTKALIRGHFGVS